MVAELKRPTGPDSSTQVVHQFDFAPIDPWVKRSASNTLVKHCDGSSTLYNISGQALPTWVRCFGADKALIKQTTFGWRPNQWLDFVEVSDGHSLYHRKSFEYDAFGNPTLSHLTGDLTGNGNLTTTTIRREFSQDGRHLVLLEAYENGKIYRYRYLPETHLLTAKYTQDGDHIVRREFYQYDACCNLIREIQDDGVSEDSQDLSGISQRLITDYILRDTQPFLHMREWVEEKYVEDGVEKLLKATHFLYDSFGNVVEEHIFDGDRKPIYQLYKTYNQVGDLLSETNPIGQKATYVYDDRRLCIRETSFSGRQTIKRVYDANKRLIEETKLGDDGIRHQTSFTYDPLDRLIKKTNPYGNSIQYAYAPIVNQMSQKEEPPALLMGGQIGSATTKYTYDALGRKKTETDPNGNATHYRYNAYGSLTEIIHPDNVREYFRYTPTGQLASHQDRQGITILYRYDVLDRPTAKTYHAANGEFIGEEITVYNGFHPVQKKDLEGNWTTYAYDGAGRLVSEDVAGRITHYTYDFLGNVTSMVECNGENSLVTCYERDLLGRILSVMKKDTLGNLLSQYSQTYDLTGEISSKTQQIDGKTATETFAYDSIGRLIRHVDALGEMTRIAYHEHQPNHLGQRVLIKQVIEPGKKITATTFDASQRPVRKEVYDTNGRTWSDRYFVYDRAGNLSYRTDDILMDGIYQNTQRVCFTYSKTNEMLTYTREYESLSPRTTSFTYFPNGHIATKTKPDGVTLRYTLDALGFLNQLSSSDGTLALEYTHNRLGQLLEAIDRNQNVRIARTLDPFGNLLSEDFGNGLKLTKTYDAFGRPLSLTLPNAQIDYAYDPLFLRKVTYDDGSGLECCSHAYDSYDLSGHLLSETPPFGYGTVKHSYDPQGRLVSLESLGLSQACAFDPEGNLARSEFDDTVSQYGYDGLSQLSTEQLGSHSTVYSYDSNYNCIQNGSKQRMFNHLNELVAEDDQAFSYDLNGNLTERSYAPEPFTYTYDALNRLKSVTTGDQRWEMQHDPLGRRLSKSTLTATDSGWIELERELYLYDGYNEIGAFTPDGLRKNLRVLGYALQRDWPNTVLVELSGKPFVPLLDCQGNIRKLWDPQAGLIASIYDYSAFGEILTPQQPFDSPWKYASKRMDQGFNLIYFGHRYYDPSLRRWLTTDPEGFVNGTNLYQYLLNNPFRYIDPDGRFAFVIPLFAFTFGAAGISWVAPSIAAILATTAVYLGVQVACQYIDRIENEAMYRDKDDEWKQDYDEDEEKLLDRNQQEKLGDRGNEKNKHKPDHTGNNKSENEHFKYLAEDEGKKTGYRFDDDKRRRVHDECSKR